MREYLLRSFLFVPAHNKKYIEKSLSCGADAIILDLEDSVPSEHKTAARKIVKEYFNMKVFNGKQVFIRINEIGTKDFIEDIKECVFEDLCGFMPSKIQNADDIKFLDRLLSMIEVDNNLEMGKLTLAPLIEKVSAVVDINNIAKASKRLAALCFGGEDYLNDLGSTYIHLTSAFSYPRSVISIAARAAGIHPIDTPFLELNDRDGFLAEEKEIYNMGFSGCLLINPKQVELANECFTPSKEEMDNAIAIIEAAELASREKASGIAVYNGVMIGPPMLKRAYSVLLQKELIEKFTNSDKGCGNERE